MNDAPIAAVNVPEQAKKTNYPPPFSDLVAGRIKRRLGEHFGLTHYGINLSQLAPGSASSVLHSHAREDEFIFILSGTPLLILDGREYPLKAGDCCGFKAGTGKAHQLVNRSSEPVSYLEMGNRAPDEQVEYPNDDLAIVTAPDGRRVFAHKDGTPY